MTRDDTIALWNRCEKARLNATRKGLPKGKAHEAAKIVWDNWLRTVMLRKEALKSSGQFKLSSKYNDYWEDNEVEGANTETQQWIEFSTVDFTGYDFDPKSPIISPNFSGFVFPGKVYFYRCVFHELPLFNQCEFDGVVRFSGTNFMGGCDLVDAAFNDLVRFRRCEFGGNTRFNRTIFNANAVFSQATFRRYVNFSNAHFKKEVFFDALHAERAFLLDGCEFTTLPRFNQSNFKEAPDFDAV